MCIRDSPRARLGECWRALGPRTPKDDGCWGGSRLRDDVHEDALARLGEVLRCPCAQLELDAAVHKTPDGVVAAEADVVSRVLGSAALPHNDVARLDPLAVQDRVVARCTGAHACGAEGETRGGARQD